jgi:hypothetical protein
MREGDTRNHSECPYEQKPILSSREAGMRSLRGVRHDRLALAEEPVLGLPQTDRHQQPSLLEACRA